MGTINAAQFLLNQRLLANKIIFFRVCSFYQHKPLKQLLDDQLFINDLYHLIVTDPCIRSRAFQLSMESTLHRRHFAEDV